MVLAYDSANAPAEGTAILFLSLFTLLLTACALWHAAGWRIPLPAPLARIFGPHYKGLVPWILPVALLYGLVSLGVAPLLDRARVGHLEAEDLEVSQGTIGRVWETRQGTRDTRLFAERAKRTRIVEGFSLGDESFSWPKARCLSAATLCALSDSAVPLHAGLRVKVTWFRDPLAFGRRRIVRLEVEPH